MPLRQRIFWSLIGTFATVFALLAILSLIVVAVVRPASAIIVGVVSIVDTIILAAALTGAYISSRRLAISLEGARNVIRQLTLGNFDERIPLQNRFLIEQVAESLDEMQKQMQTRFAELQTNRDQLRTVVDSMLEGVIAVNHAQRVVLVNDSASNMFRFKENPAIGRPLWEVIRNPQFQAWVNQALVQAEPVGGELELLSPVSRILSVRAARLPSQNPPGAVVVVSDISQLRRLEGVRQEFVANASHELKTPLASIKACVETLLDGAIDDIDHRLRFLNTINEQSDRLDKLVRDLLSLTRIESGGMKPDLHPLSIADMVTICIERNRQHAERKSMQLISQPPTENVLVLADEEALEQILDNLLDNAIKYTNAGGMVTIRWKTQDHSCILEVEDTGIGIPQSHQLRIFERFYRVDRARSRELGGTGLGLSIVKHLTQAMEGVVSVQSRLGKGSTFTIQLRLVE